ncbi:MAG: M1 family metallopeptidase [Myxococcales bacterium]|nr:M1 family metallopeptidase [Myxococcales bacterium]
MHRSSRLRTPRYRLPDDVRPESVDLHVDVDPSKSDRFQGDVSIALRLDRASRSIRLHARDLRVTQPRIRWGDQEMRGRIESHPAVEMIEVQFPKSVPAGGAVLELNFSGRLRTDLCGLYGASVGKRRYAFTQLEATDARKFFPCFDEPSMKARFRIAVTTGAANAVISNTPVRRTRRLPSRRKRVEFSETPPLSTYLVALAVGELERSRPTRLGPTEIRIWHTPGKARLTAFGLEAAHACLDRLERYFDLPYPYAKLDLVAVPDFEFGAMENAGAVFFRETLLLLDPATSTLPERKRAAEVIAHELAHMWYGNLVTMAWWDDLWLNEAFATWMAFVVVDDWRPEWKMWHDFQHGRAAALEMDALRHTHPIYVPVKTAAEANQNFDLITYEKGAAVVRMIERYLGSTPFRKGVRLYIRRHRESNTVAADLWTALSEASGESVEPMVRAWIEQSGYPVLTIRKQESGGRTRVDISQEPFVERKRRGKSSNTRWPVPWVARVGSKRGVRSHLERHLLTRARQRIELAGSGAGFLYGNADESGFFRPHHARRDFEQLLRRLNGLSAVERMGLVDHQWALVRAGRADFGSFMDLATTLADERDPDVLMALHKPLGFLADGLIPDAAPRCGSAYATWIQNSFGPHFEAAGWKPRASENDADRMRRAALLHLVGGIGGSEAVLEAAAHHCERYLDNRRAIDANLADDVVGLAARTGGAALHRRFREAAKSARTPQEQRRFLLALGAFRDPKLIERSLELSLTGAVATQDVIFLLTRMLANPAAREPTWRFVQRRWSRLYKRMPSLLASRLVESTSNLLTSAHRREVATFFARHPVPSGSRALRQSLERFDWYRGFRGRAARDLRDWIDAR